MPGNLAIQKNKRMEVYPHFTQYMKISSRRVWPPGLPHSCLLTPLCNHLPWRVGSISWEGWLGRPWPWYSQNVPHGTGMGEASLLLCKDGHADVQTTSLPAHQERPSPPSAEQGRQRGRRKERGWEGEEKFVVFIESQTILRGLCWEGLRFARRVPTAPCANPDCSAYCSESCAVSPIWLGALGGQQPRLARCHFPRTQLSAGHGRHSRNVL